MTEIVTPQLLLKRITFSWRSQRDLRPLGESLKRMTFLVASWRFAPIGHSVLMRAAGAVFPKYAQTPQNLTHPVNDRKFDHQSQ
jgi:hypothetical protein